MSQTDEMTPWVQVLGIQSGRPEFNPWNLHKSERGELTPLNCYMTSTCISTYVHAVKHNNKNKQALVFIEYITRNCGLLTSSNNNV